MSEQNRFEIEEQQERWVGGWLKWCPTSPSLLREAEKALLSNLKSAYSVRDVNVGDCIGKEESYIWTIILNEDSPKILIVFLHGFGCGWVFFFFFNFDSIAAHGPVYAFDTIGFGRSLRPAFSKDPIEAEREFIITIEAWREKMNLNKFTLLGHSFGGFLAASYAIKYPERIEHLILAEPWGLSERPVDGYRYNGGFWVKPICIILEYFNPFFIVRAAGPLGPKLLQKVRPDLRQIF
ncbi:(Lyso)-N-acylphosphatidylethanolamine lipase-like [Palaemon carinicauda]|uniref:(Lyso)-N-acylphosphatidylethanolamine lipase-like n=1 Tax=Palaemon carinicauda TaxID=392227 RepID=UPI0035B59EDF